MKWLGLIFIIIALVERLWKYQKITRFFNDDPPLPPEFRGEFFVSILQPILSGDPTLWGCLEGNLNSQTNYQREFLWLVDDNDLVGISGCEELISQYSDCQIRLLIFPLAEDGISPKTYKLIEGLKEAQGTIITVLDDDTILPDWAIDKSITLLDNPQAGAVFGLPYYFNFSNIWSSCLSAVVNGNSLLTYIPYTYIIDPMTINGMFFVMKREVLDQVNGFSGLEREIVDDYAIAQRFRQQGYKVVQSSVCHQISTQVDSFSQYLNIVNRWFIFPQASIMKGSTFLELLVFYGLVVLPSCFPLLVVLVTLFFPSIYTVIASLVYFISSYWMLGQFNEKYLNQSTPKHLIWLLVLIQIILPFSILIALFSPKRINWRGNIMELNNQGGFNFVARRNGQGIN